LEIFGGIVVLAIMVLLSGIKVVKDNNRLVVYRFGRVVATKGAGVHLIVPILESAETVDTRMMMLDTPVLTATTLDGQTVNVSAVCMFQVGDAKKAVTKVANATEATGTLAQTILRSVVGHNDLKTLQSEQRGINKRLKTALEKQTREWGINIKSVEIKTLTTSPQQPALDASQTAIDASQPPVKAPQPLLDAPQASAGSKQD
jgi:regulator of protease activity HflC (stomatin/prohibitin superfamily)